MVLDYIGTNRLAHSKLNLGYFWRPDIDVRLLASFPLHVAAACDASRRFEVTHVPVRSGQVRDLLIVFCFLLLSSRPVDYGFMCLWPYGMRKKLRGRKTREFGEIDDAARYAYILYMKRLARGCQTVAYRVIDEKSSQEQYRAKCVKRCRCLLTPRIRIGVQD
jgi:hypothetical protein